MGHIATVFADNSAADLTKAWPAAISPEDEAALRHALADGTTIATDTGWQPVETLQLGDWVLGPDGRFQEVCRVERHTLWSAHGFPRRIWPLRVPPDLLDNATPMYLLPRQRVRLGRPSILAEAMRLEGLAGVEACDPGRALAVTRIRFAKPRLILANYGAILRCPGPAAKHEPSPPAEGEADVLDIVPMRG